MNVNLLVQLIRIYKVRAARKIAIPLVHRIQLTRTFAIHRRRARNFFVRWSRSYSFGASAMVR